MNRNRRVAAHAILACLVGSALGGVLPAAVVQAGATVTPDQAVQGAEAHVEFRLTSDRPGAYTKTVELILPADKPITEVYPLSVPDWAPKVVYRTVAGADGQAQVVSSITWIALGKAARKPGVSMAFPVSLAPMPATDSLAFPVVQTYSDGTVIRWDDLPNSTGAAVQNPAPVLKMLPASSVQAAGQSTAAGTSGREPQAGAAAGAGSGMGRSWLAVTLALAAVVSVAGLALLARAGLARRRTRDGIGPDGADIPPAGS